MMEGMIVDPKSALRFILGGDATVTLVSRRTGARLTYKVRQKKEKSEPEPPLYFVSLLTGPDNENDYSPIGIIVAKGGGWAFYPTRKARMAGINEDAPSVRAMRWALRFLPTGMPPQTDVWHDGRCGKCGRPLTVPESISTGIGPVCMAKG